MGVVVEAAAYRINMSLGLQSEAEMSICCYFSSPKSSMAMLFVVRRRLELTL